MRLAALVNECQEASLAESKSILVTGGAGYIGSHTAKALHHAGHSPVVFDDLSNGHREAVQWGPFVHGDVRDAGALSACMRLHDIQAVIHFAGLIEVGRSVEAPELFWDHNLNGVAAVLRAMRECDVPRIVFSSTAAVYGMPASNAALAETDTTQPINPYGDSKLACERLIAAYGRAYGVEGVALRYFNAAGADADRDIGEAHCPESHLIPLAIEAALGLGPSLSVFGDDFDTHDGSGVRDYVHVSDLAAAHVLALTADLGATPFAAINLGLGRGHSVLEVIGAVAEVIGHTTPFHQSSRRPGDPAVLVANPGLAASWLGWKPQHTDLKDIVASAVAWRIAPRFGNHLGARRVAQA